MRRLAICFILMALATAAGGQSERDRLRRACTVTGLFSGDVFILDEFTVHEGRGIIFRFSDITYAGYTDSCGTRVVVFLRASCPFGFPCLAQEMIDGGWQPDEVVPPPAKSR